VADKLKAEELKPGHKITDLEGFSEPPIVEWVSQVDEGIVVPILRITFCRTTFKVLCNADRVYTVESSVPGPLPSTLT
jgi:hypothetical protein